MRLATTPTITNHTMPASIAAAKTPNLPTNPEVSGMPARASMNTANADATTGDLRPMPNHVARFVASPPASRTMVMIANAPIVVKPYAMR